MELNKAQKDAVTHTYGPCMVVAGPGSGKTFVITSRIINMIKVKKINPKNIIVITFTKEAAMQMKRRFFIHAEKENLIDTTEVKKADVTFGTFHAIYFEILRDSFGYSMDSVIDENEKREYIKRALSICKSKKHLKNEDISKKENEKIRAVYSKLLKEDKKLDYEEMIIMCKKLLSSNRSILKKYQDKYKYFLIDEFQDINDSQYEIVKLVCKSKNIFVVGDDDQSIYEFRGASGQIFRKFEKDYKICRKIILNINYRSVSKIVNFSSRIINNNISHLPKELVSASDKKGFIEIRSFNSKDEESLYIVHALLKNHERGIPYSQMAVLFRTNVIPYTLIYYLVEYKIPFLIGEKIAFGSGYKKLFKDYFDLKNAVVTKKDAVSLFTFHASKGLEFIDVHIVEANDGIIPHKKNLARNELEGERRLFYVACTRAKENLHILYIKDSLKPSRFIFEGIK